ncbi:uncharacterized protein At2g27730, mitochondrial [Amaranthus tricolor]|uniref:uncharacterized protein At2g27730, mitochondrial n=1 Tax=Amaranthus tricolor TaxID=29722 RepID=UPI002582EB1D|nr:uncharacterized protein At2g27730, mitochondrial [Amaranthus tricolor]
MAMRSVARMASSSSLRRVVEGVSPRASFFACYSSDGRGGRVLSEEERAKETVYIQKMEKERLEKLKQKADKEKAQKEKEASEKKADGETH